MYVHIPSDQVIHEGQGFTFNEVQYPSNWQAADALALGFVPVTRVDNPPSDPENYYRTEDRVGAVATAVYTRMLDEQIKQRVNSAIDAQIKALEAQELLPRLVRQSLVKQLVVDATAAGVTLDQLYAMASLPNAPEAAIGYKKFKDFDDEIVALRNRRMK